MYFAVHFSVRSSFWWRLPRGLSLLELAFTEKVNLGLVCHLNCIGTRIGTPQKKKKTIELNRVI